MAVKQYGDTLQGASEELKNDREVVLAAVTTKYFDTVARLRCIA